MNGQRFANPRRVAALFILALGAMGCGQSNRPVNTATTTTGHVTRRTTVSTTTTQPAPIVEEAQPEPTPVGDGIVVATSIQQACGLTESDMSEAKFKFGSARLEPAATRLLALIAKCVEEGKLGDSKLELVGFADPRGSEEFNHKLGLQRAQAAMHALETYRVDSKRLSADSRGESEAKGTDEASWALDRRVEVRLADEKK